MNWKRRLLVISLTEIGVSGVYPLLICPVLCKHFEITEFSYSTAAFIMTSGMIIVSLFTFLFALWERKAEMRNPRIEVWMASYLVFALVLCLIFFVTLICVEYFVELPASTTMLLVECSTSSTALHIFLNRYIVAPIEVDVITSDDKEDDDEE